MSVIETPQTVLLPPRCPRSTRFHKPSSDGSLRPMCDAFEAGTPLALGDALEVGRRRCRTCWPEAESQAGQAGQTGKSR